MMKRRGFSLLEVILVVAMTAILSGAVFFVYLACFRAWNAGENRAELRTELSQALEAITRDLYRAKDITLESAHSLRFVQGTSEFRFYLYSADDPDPPAYDKTAYRLLKSSADETYGKGTMLATGVQPTVFSYDNKVVTVDLTATKDGSTVHMRTRIRPRNL